MNTWALAWKDLLADFDDRACPEKRRRVAEYEQQNRAQLRARVEQQKAEQQWVDLRCSAGGWPGVPCSNADWVGWLEEHKDRMQSTLESVRQGEHIGQMNVRLKAESPFPAAERLEPLCPHASCKLPKWVTAMRSGFYLIQSQNDFNNRQMLHMCVLSGQRWGVELLPGLRARELCVEAKFPFEVEVAAHQSFGERINAKQRFRERLQSSDELDSLDSR